MADSNIDLLYNQSNGECLSGSEETLISCADVDLWLCVSFSSSHFHSVIDLSLLSFCFHHIWCPCVTHIAALPKKIPSFPFRLPFPHLFFFITFVISFLLCMRNSVVFSSILFLSWSFAIVPHKLVRAAWNYLLLNGLQQLAPAQQRFALLIDFHFFCLTVCSSGGRLRMLCAGQVHTK